MKLLEEKIVRDGTIRPGGIVKVDNSLNCLTSAARNLPDFSRIKG